MKRMVTIMATVREGDTMRGEELTFNPMAAEVRRDPYPFYAEMRETPGLVKVPALDAWAVSRYDDAKHVLLNHQLFSSDPLINIAFGDFNPAPGAPYMLATDPPEHTRLRKLVGAAFGPKLISAIEPSVERLVSELLDKVDPKQGFDLVEDFSAPLPVSVIADIMGIDASMAPTFRRWSNNVTVGVNETISEAQRAEIEKDAEDFRNYFLDRIAYARKNPGEDMISTLVRAEEEGQKLSADEVMAMCVLLLIAGNETTTSTIGNILYLLTVHPDQKTRVLEERDLVPNLVEEALRFLSPIQMLFRRTTEELELAGMTLPKDAIVMPIYASANRDEAAFANADQFDVGRKDANKHMAFGQGIHSCIGRALGRFEATLAMRAILNRFPRLVADVDDVAWVDSFYLRGPKKLRVAEQ